jgi:DNA-binding NarL/FixJ family response regulator
MHRRGDRPLKVHVIAASSNRRAELAELTARAAQARTSTTPGMTREQILQAGVDIIVVDVDTPATADAAIALVKSLPRAAAVVLLADNPDSGWVKQALNAGTSSILSREVTADEFHAAFSAAETGLVLLQPASVFLLGRSAQPNSSEPSSALEALTTREHEILKLMSEGLGNKEIAGHLRLSEHTVKFHISSILSKLNAGSRTEAVSLGIKRGWIPL